MAVRFALWNEGTDGMDYLKELAGRANLSASWDAWTPEYRVLAIAVALAIVYWALRVVLPAVLRILRPAFFIAFILGAVWIFFPEATCSIGVISKLPVVCVR
jgi:hypothetical protein